MEENIDLEKYIYSPGDIIQLKYEWCEYPEEMVEEYMVIEDRDTRILVKVAGDTSRFAPTSVWQKSWIRSLKIK